MRSQRAGNLTGPNPTHRAKRCIKFHIAITSADVPVAGLVTAANFNETVVFERLFRVAVAIMGPHSGRVADKGYDTEKCL